jgi:hypothetical protein
MVENFKAVPRKNDDVRLHIDWVPVAILHYGTAALVTVSVISVVLTDQPVLSLRFCHYYHHRQPSVYSSTIFVEPRHEQAWSSYNGSRHERSK